MMSTMTNVLYKLFVLKLITAKLRRFRILLLTMPKDSVIITLHLEIGTSKMNTCIISEYNGF